MSNDGDEPRYKVLATCSGGTCPTIYAQDDEHVLVQGYPVPDAHDHLGVPAGESVVRIPRSVLMDAAARLNAPAY
jgi:hypothetical protein